MMTNVQFYRLISGALVPIYSGIVRKHFASIITLNNCEIITETRISIFRWLSCCCRRRLCLSSQLSSSTPLHVLFSLQTLPLAPQTFPCVTLNPEPCQLQDYSLLISFLICSLVFLFGSTLNEYQYDGKVIAGEKAVSLRPYRIEPEKVYLCTLLKLQFG